VSQEPVAEESAHHVRVERRILSLREVDRDAAEFP
jgi:hypothetical protein